jgi:hypothetical protein
MSYNDRLNYLFATNIITGLISVYDIGKPGREKFAKNVANYPSSKGSREIVWLMGRSEFAIGGSDGSVAFWNAKRGSPICKVLVFWVLLF